MALPTNVKHLITLFVILMIATAIYFAVDLLILAPIAHTGAITTNDAILRIEVAILVVPIVAFISGHVIHSFANLKKVFESQPITEGPRIRRILAEASALLLILGASIVLFTALIVLHEQFDLKTFFTLP